VFKLTPFVFGLTSVKPNLIELTLSSVLFNNPLLFFFYLSLKFIVIHVDIMHYTDTFSLYNMDITHKAITGAPKNLLLFFKGYSLYK
jgi:hypothetical protein